MKRTARRISSRVVRRAKAQEFLDGEVGALCVTRFMGAELPEALPDIERYALDRLKERLPNVRGLKVHAGRAPHDPKLLTLSVT
jgi:hypothetical protein